MAQAEPLGAANQVIEKLDRLNSLLKQMTTNHIVQFDGTPTDFRKWVKDVHKFCIIGRLDKLTVAYQTSRGVISDFIVRDLHQHPNANPEV